MSGTGVAKLNHTVHDINVSLKAIGQQIHRGDRNVGRSALRSLPHALRDRLTPELGVHLRAQLPIRGHGVYYEGWHMGGKQLPTRTAKAFAERIAGDLSPGFDHDTLAHESAVFAVVANPIAPSETNQDRRSLAGCAEGSLAGRNSPRRSGDKSRREASAREGDP